MVWRWRLVQRRRWALSLKTAQAVRPLRAAHERLVEQWHAHGILVFEGAAKNQSAIVAKVNELPQSLRSFWKTALKAGRLTAGPAGWAGLHNMERIEDLNPLLGSVRLAYLETVRFCSILELEETSEETGRVMTKPAIELIRFDCADRAQAFSDLKQLASLNIDQGTSINQVWSQRFAPLAASCQHVSVVDAYSLQSSGGIQGLEWFAGKLNLLSRGVSLKIYASCDLEEPPNGLIPSPENLSQRVENIAKALPPGGIRALDLHLVPNGFFRKDSHGRYIRFNSDVVEMDLGLSLFNADANGYTRRRCQFGYKHEAAFHQGVESDLRGHSERGSPWIMI